MGPVNGRGENGISRPRPYHRDRRVRPSGGVSCNQGTRRPPRACSLPHDIGNFLTTLQASDRSTKPASYVATASRDKTIKLWDCQTGQILRNLVRLLRHFPFPCLSALPLRPAMITGFELSSSTPQENSFYLLVTITRFGYGSCPQEDA